MPHAAYRCCAVKVRAGQRTSFHPERLAIESGMVESLEAPFVCHQYVPFDDGDRVKLQEIRSDLLI